MSSNVVLTFHAKPEQAKQLLDSLGAFQEMAIQAGALTASLMQDKDDPTRLIELEVWQTCEEHQRFAEAPATKQALVQLEHLLFSAADVNYLDTVKYSRRRA